LAVFGNTRTFGPSAVNEFRLSYTRDANDLGKPAGGLGVSTASPGFVTGAGTLGIVPLAPESEGVENIIFNNLTIGSDPDRFYQINNNFELSDNFSKVPGNHTLKVGAQLEYYQMPPASSIRGILGFRVRSRRQVTGTSRLDLAWLIRPI
jgi:hypothetical protein